MLNLNVKVEITWRIKSNKNDKKKYNNLKADSRKREEPVRPQNLTWRENMTDANYS